MRGVGICRSSQGFAVVGVHAVFDVSRLAGCDGVVDVCEVAEVDDFVINVDISFPSLVTIGVTNPAGP